MRPIRRPPLSPRASRLALPFLAAALQTSAATARPAPITLQPCKVPGLAGEARCGSLSVPENRASKSGRRIALKIVVLPATGTDRVSDPILYLAGGPGEAATEDAAGLAMALSKVRERRDLVLVDQRGAGGSHPLNCDLFEPAADLQSYLGDFFPLPAARKCRDELERGADLTLYTTPIAMDDLDEVRDALGYEKLNVYGGSYGTRAALVYLRRHEDHVRTVILHGVSPTDQAVPLPFPRDTERALDGVLAECAAEPACQAAFPEAKAELRAVLERLASAPAPAEILHPETGAPATVRLSRDVAAETIRYMLYSPAAAAMIPAYVHAASRGDFGPLAEMALFGRQRIVASGAAGLYLSITCAEDVPWIRPGEGERAARGTVLGDYRLREQRAACGFWPRAKLPIGYRHPISSKAPVLILSGAWDPVTPPSNGTEVARSLSRSLHVVVPHGGHAFDGLEGVECVDRLAADFIERGSADGLDTACVREIRRPAFRTAVAPTRPVTLGDADLARLAGSYVGQGSPVEARFETDGGKLKVQMAGDTLLLVPVAPDLFRAVGVPFVAVRFAIADGKVRQAVIEENGVAQTTLVPKK